jgi:leader peptidase (prepilin peptidase)/N-methyltransferase
MLIVLALVLGAVIGSFLNVVIVRLPKQESLVFPGSHCPACQSSIRWFDNIPMASFLWLRGRCRECQAPISWRYPAVETAAAGLFAVAAWRFGPRPEALLPAWLFVAVLIAVTAIDLEHQLIPDRITLPGIALGFLASLVNPAGSWLASLLGIALGGGFIFVVIVVARWLLGRDAMGGGDMKLCAMIGAFLGWKLTVLTMMLAAISGGLIGGTLLILGVRERRDPIPFGPFLATGALVSLFWGDPIIRWYFRSFTP